ncbi:MAG TPA: hypothetical protein PLD84_05520 [Chitinophagales bacterium]|nr:hypothetical protein [Chitinophagales bacterium]
MNKTKLILGALLISGAAIYSSCQKDAITPGFGNQDLTGALDEAFADNESAKIDDIVNIVAYDNFSGVRGIIDQLPACATVTYDTLITPKSVTVDFGATPCLSEWDNKYRTGIIKIMWTGSMKDVGTVKTVSTDNYFVGTTVDSLNQFDFTKTITNMGLNANGNVHFAINVPSATITLIDGATITWIANRDREWIQGIGTPDPDDDSFLITGESSGTDRMGQPFTVEITTPLLKNACAWIVSGIKEVTHGANPTRVIDYGNGDCDDVAVVKVNGNEKVIHL